MVGNKNFVFVRNIEFWKVPSWERNILEHGINTTHTITTEKSFFFVYHKFGIWNKKKQNRFLLSNAFDVYNLRLSKSL